MDREQIRAIVREVIEAMFESSIPVGVSNKHVHLCQEDWNILFPNQSTTKVTVCSEANSPVCFKSLFLVID